MTRRPTRNTSSIPTPPSTARTTSVQKNSALKLETVFRTEFIHHPEVRLRGTRARPSRANAKSSVLTTNEWFAVSRRFRGKCKLYRPRRSTLNCPPDPSVECALRRCYVLARECRARGTPFRLNGGRFFVLLKHGNASACGLYFKLRKVGASREVPMRNIRFMPAHFGKLRPKWTSPSQLPGADGTFAAAAGCAAERKAK